MAKAGEKGNRGFIREVTSPKTYQAPSVQLAKPKAFTYSKPVVPKSVQSEAMNTPRRLSQHKAVAPAKSTLCGEAREHINTRQGKK